MGDWTEAYLKELFGPDVTIEHAHFRNDYHHEVVIRSNAKPGLWIEYFKSQDGTISGTVHVTGRIHGIMCYGYTPLKRVNTDSEMAREVAQAFTR